MKARIAYILLGFIALSMFIIVNILIVRMAVQPLADEVQRLKAEASFQRAERIAEDNVIRAIHTLGKKMDPNPTKGTPSEGTQ